MANPYIWGDLARSINDNTTIDAAIGEAIEAHLDDPDAHLDVTGSLQSHRAAEIIDHVAESVVNDKIKANTRAYVAIVDPASEHDFASIEAACNYAKTVGGGNVLIMPGNYYINGVLELEPTCNLYGLDPDTTFVHTDKDNGNYIIAQFDSSYQKTNLNIMNLTFITGSAGGFYGYGISAQDYGNIYFESCVFKGSGGYVIDAAQNMYFNRCIFYLTTTAAIANTWAITVTDCTLYTETTSGTLAFIGLGPADETNYLWVQRVNTVVPFSRSVNFLDGGPFANVFMSECRIVGWTNDLLAINGGNIIGNRIYFNSTGYLNLEGPSIIITGNRFDNGSGNRVRLTSGCEDSVVVANAIGTPVTNNGYNNLVATNLTT